VSASTPNRLHHRETAARQHLFGHIHHVKPTNEQREVRALPAFGQFLMVTREPAQRVLFLALVGPAREPAKLLPLFGGDGPYFLAVESTR
jgi:hypothetical protein